MPASPKKPAIPAPVEPEKSFKEKFVDTCVLGFLDFLKFLTPISIAALKVVVHLWGNISVMYLGLYSQIHAHENTEYPYGVWYKRLSQLRDALMEPFKFIALALIAYLCLYDLFNLRRNRNRLPLLMTLMYCGAMLCVTVPFTGSTSDYVNCTLMLLIFFRVVLETTYFNETLDLGPEDFRNYFVFHSLLAIFMGSVMCLWDSVMNLDAKEVAIVS